MKRVIILEHAAHFEVARAYARIFTAAGWEVVLSVNEQNATFLHPVFDGCSTVTFQVLRAGSDEEQYWTRLDQIIENSNLVIVCSHETRGGGLLDKRGKTPWYLVIHDGFNYLDPLRHLAWKGGIFQWLRIGKYIFSAYFSKRKKSALLYDGWLTPVEWPQEWVTKSGAKKVVYLPFLWNETTTQPHNEKLHLVIPGTVNLRSRDYYMVADALELLSNKVREKGIKITLLGKYKGKKERHLIYMMLKSCGPKIELNYFYEHIDSQEFDAIMQSADLLWLPLHNEWQYGVVMEKGGVSCLSGNIGDWVRFGKTVMIPSHYPVPPLLHSKSKIYHNVNEAVDLILGHIPANAEQSTPDVFTIFNHQQIERVKSNWA